MYHAARAARHVALPSGARRQQSRPRPVVAEAGGEVVVEVDCVVAAGRPQGVALQVQRLGNRRSSRRGGSRVTCVLRPCRTSTLRSRCARSRRPSPCPQSGRRASSSSEDACPAICCALERPPFDRYAVVPVARNMWQHVEDGSPAAAPHRLIIARDHPPLGRPARQPPPPRIHALEDRPTSSSPGRTVLAQLRLSVPYDRLLGQRRGVHAGRAAPVELALGDGVGTVEHAGDGRARGHGRGARGRLPRGVERWRRAGRHRRRDGRGLHPRGLRRGADGAGAGNVHPTTGATEETTDQRGHRGRWRPGGRR